MKKLAFTTLIIGLLAFLEGGCTRGATTPAPASVVTTQEAPAFIPTLTPSPSATIGPAVNPTVVAAPTTTPMPVSNQTPFFSPTPSPATTATPVTTAVPTPTATAPPTVVATPTIPRTPGPVPPAPSPAPTPQRDTAPPPPIAGVIAVNAYDGKVNLFWDRSVAPDFDHYNLYVTRSPAANTTDLKPVFQIRNTAANAYQVTGLEPGIEYYFSVSAVDKSGNENRQLVWATATATGMPRGTPDPNLTVDIYQSGRVWVGTTLLTLNHDPQKRRIVEVNMLGEVIWEHVVTQRGFVEAELLANNNVLYTVGQTGIYEVDRSGKTVWSCLTNKVDHDADRLPNGNTIYVSAEDQKSDPQVMEVNPSGQVVWSWYARDHFDKPPYRDIRGAEGYWTHTNAVTRLANGNTLISTRDFHMVVEVDPKGKVIGTYGEGVLVEPHDPEVMANGNILVASHNTPERAVEIDTKTGKVVWQSPPFPPVDKPVRDANRLPNGNTLITAATRIVEVTREGQIVWQLALKGMTPAWRPAPNGFYKADRISVTR